MEIKSDKAKENGILSKLKGCNVFKPCCEPEICMMDNEKKCLRDLRELSVKKLS